MRDCDLSKALSWRRGQRRLNFLITKTDSGFVAIHRISPRSYFYTCCVCRRTCSGQEYPSTLAKSLVADCSMSSLNIQVLGSATEPTDLAGERGNVQSLGASPTDRNYRLCTLLFLATACELTITSFYKSLYRLPAHHLTSLGSAS